MIMPPRLRKFALTAHITCSVGWFGAVASFVVLSVIGLRSSTAQLVRAAYLAMKPITWFAIVPLAFASLLTGIVSSLGTGWGLFRYYWVVGETFNDHYRHRDLAGTRQAPRAFGGDSGQQQSD